MELIVAQKQKSAEKIVQAIDSRYNTKNINNQKVYVVDDKNLIVTHVSGHLCTWSYPSKYGIWKNINLNELIHDSPIEKFIPGFEQNFKTIFKQYTITKLGIFTDNDSQGELIGQSIQKLVFKILKTKTLDVVRYYTSSMTKSAILFAKQNPGEINDAIAESARTKHHIDLQWGTVLTVIFTIYGKLLYTLGRVQTPVLNLLVDRHKQIKEFKTSTYTLCHLFLETGIKFVSQPIYEQAVLSNIKTGIVTPHLKITSGQYRWPPKPLNSTDLLKFATKLNIDGKICMKLAETLYLQGVITYPRTASRYTTFDTLSEIYSVLCPQQKYDPYIIRCGQKDPAHPPIVPTKAGGKNLKGLESKLYTHIFNHYIKILQGPTILDTYEYTITMSDVKFKYETEKLVKQGWYSTAEFLPLTGNYKIVDVQTETKVTKPPVNYTEGSIVKKMQQLKIGTKSTRHTFINILRQRQYLKGFIPQTKAITLINTLKTIVPIITTAELTANIELDLSRIELNLINRAQTYTKYSNILLSVLEKIELNKHVVIKTFSKLSSTAAKYPKTGFKYNKGYKKNK